MDEDPAQGVRRKKDSSLVRAAELVRDGRAVGHGERRQHRGDHGVGPAAHGAAPGGGAALHRHPAAPVSAPARRCWWTPGPTPSARRPCWCSSPRWARPTWPPATGSADPTVGLLSIGEEPTKGTPLVKEAHGLLAGGGRACASSGIVEGRDLLPSPADVVVTDGFTGNVTLKTLEGSLRFLLETLFGVFGTDEATQAASEVLVPHLLPIAAELDPENTGGAMLLGVDGVCVISHGSSSPWRWPTPCASPTSWRPGAWSTSSPPRWRPSRGPASA